MATLIAVLPAAAVALRLLSDAGHVVRRHSGQEMEETITEEEPGRRHEETLRERAVIGQAHRADTGTSRASTTARQLGI